MCFTHRVSSCLSSKYTSCVYILVHSHAIINNRSHVKHYHNAGPESTKYEWSGWLVAVWYNVQGDSCAFCAELHWGGVWGHAPLENFAIFTCMHLMCVLTPLSSAGYVRGPVCALLCRIAGNFGEQRIGKSEIWQPSWRKQNSCCWNDSIILDFPQLPKQKTSPKFPAIQ